MKPSRKFHLHQNHHLWITLIPFLKIHPDLAVTNAVVVHLQFNPEPDLDSAALDVDA